MKEVIRQGIFETNSSSSHAVTIKRKRPGEPWRTERQIAGGATKDYTLCSEKEIRSPYEKMMLVWGIECEDIAWLTVVQEEDGGADDEAREARLFAMTVHERFRDALLDECAKVAAFDRAEALELMDDCTQHGYSHPLCCRFFNEDVLDECTCGMSIGTIARFLHMDSDRFDDAYYREFAGRLFAEDVYFVTGEGYYGGCWYIDRVIF